MTIHVVVKGDTISSVAKQYGVSPERLMLDNGIMTMSELVPGQTIVVAYPEKSYIVQEGDSLNSIAASQGISLIQLLRNNPYLSDRENIFPGETLVISYDNHKGKITTNGYANSYIDLTTLKKTLPYLTYLSIFGNRTTEDAEIIEVDDEEIIKLAKIYHVAPIMLLSTLTAQGIGSLEVSYHLLYNQQLISKHINNVLRLLQKKGYYGVNLTYQFINEENRSVYENYTRQITERLHQEGYVVFITLSENFILEVDNFTFEKIDYSNVAQAADGVTLLNYNWGYSFGPPAPVASVHNLRKFLDYVAQMIPPVKTEIGLPIIGYDWELPYIIGVTRANALTLDSAITLARFVGASIQFDEISQTPYFRYVVERNRIPRRHIVWFIDARSINAILDLVKEYGFRGSGIWNIMNYYPQMWLIMNSQYEIETILN
jgi:spore germination protein